MGEVKHVSLGLFFFELYDDMREQTRNDAKEC